MKNKEYHVANFATFVSKTLIFSPHNMDEFNFKRAEYCINKIIELTKPLFGRFQNGCNKVVIEPLVVQFWSEIILVISNRTRAARSFDFEITRMISAQIALHSVQLPLFIRFSVSVDEEITFYPTLFFTFGTSNLVPQKRKLWDQLFQTDFSCLFSKTANCKRSFIWPNFSFR